MPKGTFCAAYPSALNTNFQRKMHGNGKMYGVVDAMNKATCFKLKQI